MNISPWTVLLVLFGHPVHPLAENLTLCGRQVHLIYANGMNNGADEAELSLKALFIDLNAKLEDSQKLSSARSQLAYNYDDLLPLELLEAYEQKGFEKMRMFWQWYYGWTTAPDWFRGIIEKYLEFYQRKITNFSNTQEQIENYRRVLSIAMRTANIFAIVNWKPLFEF